MGTIFLVALALLQGPAPPEASRELKLGPPVERAIQGREQHAYRLTLETGTFVVVSAIQKGVDLVVSAADPAGVRIGENDFKATADGEEWFALVAVQPGDYRIGIRASRPDAPPGRYQIGLKELRQASSLDEHRVEGDRLRREGYGLWRRGEAGALEEALLLLGRARTLYGQVGWAAGEARMLGDMGAIHQSLGRHVQALAHYELSLPLRRAGRDQRGEAMTLSNIGLAYSATGRPHEALGKFHEALALWRGQGIRSGEGLTLHQLGYIHVKLGDYQAALDVLREALAVSRAAQERATEATSLATLGALYRHLGEDEIAHQHLVQARALFQALRDHRGEGRALSYLVEVYRKQGRLANASAAAQKAADLYRTMGDRSWEAGALIKLGAVETDRGHAARASKELEAGLELARRAQDLSLEASALQELGRLSLKRGDTRAARELLLRALPLAEASGNRPETLDGHHLLALALRDLGDLEGARRESASALAIVESLRAEVLAPELRATYRSGVQDPYALHVDVLMRLHDRHPDQGHANAALEALERGRARSLVELLAEGRLDLRGAIDPELLRREESQQARMAWLQGRLRELRPQKGTPEEVKALHADLDAADAERLRIEEEIRGNSPLYAQIRYPRPLDLAGVQALLDPDTALVEYALGEPSYVFVVSREGLQARRIASANEIRVQVQALRKALRQPGRLGRSTSLRAAHWLYEHLIVPVEAALVAKRQLLIAPDGALGYLPFEALLTAKADPSVPDDRLPLLLRRWAVSYVPSANALAAIGERRPDSDPGARSGGPELVVFADPALPAPQGGSGQVGEPAAEETLRGILDEVGLAALPPLPHSRREAEGVARLFAGDQVAVYLDTAATEINFKEKADVTGARGLHFATHALVSARRPARSALVLARTEGSKEDGLLQAFELSGLKLRADLVVLSACETGLGRELKGEGIMGLTRTFLHAGAASVVASLWQVADRSTADLMLAFYRHRGETRSKSEALRRAKLELLEGKRFAHPFHWAPFVLVGQP